MTFSPEKDAVLKRLQDSAERVWEIRVLEPEQYRIFGFFAYQDTFIGTHIEHRDNVGEDFDAEIDAAKSHWSRLFPDHNPFRSDHSHKYLSEGLDYV